MTDIESCSGCCVRLRDVRDDQLSELQRGKSAAKP
jgi:hypothetical protein